MNGKAKRYWLAFFAALTCPCHVPLLALLFTGTAAGAFLGEHMGGAIALMSLVFVLSLGLAITRLEQSEPESRTNAEECGPCAQDAAEAESRDVPPAAPNARYRPLPTER